MKYPIILCFLLVTIIASAQYESTFLLQTQSGYEYNIFRFPDSFFDPELDEVLGPEDLYTNSLYQEGSFRVLLTKKWRDQEISLRMNPSGKLYLEEREASYYTLYNRLRYINRFSKKTKFTATLRYNFRDREGQNLDEGVFRTPLGYGHFEANSKLDFRLYKSNRASFSIRYANRNYQSTEENDLAYNLLGANLVFRNVFKTRYGYHSYGVELDVSNRKYTRLDFEEETETLRRNWNYSSVKGFYRYPVNETLTIAPEIGWSNRVDLDSGRFSYTQLQPALRVLYETETFSAELNTSYATRNFEQLRATDSENNDLGLLNFKYTRAKLEIEQKLSKNLSLAFDGYLNIRDSNRTNVDRVLFRSFDYYYAGIGLQWRF